jgi:xylan 1,4-beta-xylosidase
VYYTEWNISSNPRDHCHDEPFAAAFAAKVVQETDAFVDGYSFWTFSDIFEENYSPSVPFHGGFGCSTSTAFPSRSIVPSKLLHQLGTERLPVDGTHGTVDAWVVRKGRSVTVFLTNHAQPRRAIATELVRIEMTNAPRPRSASRQSATHLAGDGSA